MATQKVHMLHTHEYFRRTGVHVYGDTLPSCEYPNVQNCKPEAKRVFWASTLAQTIKILYSGGTKCDEKLLVFHFE